MSGFGVKADMPHGVSEGGEDKLVCGGFHNRIDATVGALARVKLFASKTTAQLDGLENGAAYGSSELFSPKFITGSN